MVFIDCKVGEAIHIGDDIIVTPLSVSTSNITFKVETIVRVQPQNTAVFLKLLGSKEGAVGRGRPKKKKTARLLGFRKRSKYKPH